MGIRQSVIHNDECFQDFKGIDYDSLTTNERSYLVVVITIRFKNGNYATKTKVLYGHPDKINRYFEELSVEPLNFIKKHYILSDPKNIDNLYFLDQVNLYSKSPSSCEQI